MIICDGQKMRGGEVIGFPSVGATENVMLAAVWLPAKP
jgi:UDP-N-acetylglucosamine enolpyruvyl transferase